MKCPKCKSGNLEPYHVDGAECASCEDCGFDTCAGLELDAGEKTSQKAKGSYQVYKKGGSLRARK